MNRDANADADANADDDGPFPDDPEDTRTAIMKATFDALCTHGYADLTIQRIGAEFPKSKSLLYHHYDGKDDLLVEFLGYMIERFEERELPADADADAETRLRGFLDHVVVDHLADDDGEGPNAGFLRAIVELRAQGAHDPAYREQFTRTREHFHDHLETLIADGVAEGVFRDDVDPDDAADFLVTVVGGAMFDRVTTDTDAAAAVRAELDRYVDGCLLAR